jgi:hypothetical protein
MIMRTGVANLPLHGGSCPRWLFPRMARLGGAISEIIVDEHGREEYLRRLSDPYFFQALGCVLGFDFHSSGLTTTVCGALKESVNKQNLGITFAGGKGKTSRRTLSEIGSSEVSTQNIERLQYASKITAKVDSALIQDSYNLYHHVIVFTEKANWCVIQQGMNQDYARRYHWLSDNVGNFVEEPHSAICCDKTETSVLDMTARESRENQEICLDLVKDNPKHLEKYLRRPAQRSLDDFSGRLDEFTMARRHTIIDMDKRNRDTLKRAYEIQPENYEELVALQGVGPKTVRSLALISELIYGAKPSWSDPVKYSFAHGGKDGIPYPVDRQLMDSSTEILRNAIRQSRLGDYDKLHALQRLGQAF